MKLEDGGYPELKSDLKQFLNSGKWQLELQSGQQLPEKVTMGVTVKAWGVANSLTGFTAISFCGLYLSIIFIILSCSVLAFEQLSAIDKNQKNYAVIDRLGVPGHRQASLIRRELSTVFFDPTAIPSFADGFADSRGTVLFRRGNLAAGTCASLWFGDDPAILCNLPDLFWCNNVLIQTGYSSA